MKSEVGGEEKEREPELPLDEAVDGEADDRERRGQRRDARDQVTSVRMSGSGDDALLELGDVARADLDRHAVLVRTADGVAIGTTPRAPAEATVCDCCACEPLLGLSLLSMPPDFFGSSSFFVLAVGRLLVVAASCRHRRRPARANLRPPSRSRVVGLASKVMFLA